MIGALGGPFVGSQSPRRERRRQQHAWRARRGEDAAAREAEGWAGPFRGESPSVLQSPSRAGAQEGRAHGLERGVADVAVVRTRGAAGRDGPCCVRVVAGVVFLPREDPNNRFDANKGCRGPRAAAGQALAAPIVPVVPALAAQVALFWGCALRVLRLVEAGVRLRVDRLERPAQVGEASR